MGTKSGSGSTVPELVQFTGAEAEDGFDVVVVGFGIAGGCAALEAARAGARVLILERAATHGGTSSMSGGHFYLGGGTAVQVATGQDDTAEEMFQYLVSNSKQPDIEKIRAYCDGSVEHFNWLEALGFQFERSYYPGKAVIQPQTQGLMYTGNEKVWPFRERAVPAPRGHKVPVPGDTGGTKLVMDLLRESCEKAGVEVWYETGATNLLADHSGAVRGVQWKHFSESGKVSASAVILAAGGFVMNPDMIAEYVPHLEKLTFQAASTYDDGLGIRLGQSAGAALDHMEEGFVTAPFYPPGQMVTGIIVNKSGRRFVSEESYHSRTAHQVMLQEDRCAYLILDSDHVAQPEMPLVPLIDGFDTIEEMAEGLGLPVDALSDTIASYNEHAALGEDPHLHKHPDWLEAQDAPPWAVFDLSLTKAMYTGFTLGGIRTNVDGQAERGDGSVIPGLYASGACASNIAQDGSGYCSGTQLGEGSFFGRRAGVHAAAFAVAHAPNAAPPTARQA